MPYWQQFESVTIETKAIEQYCKEVLSEILLEGFFLQFFGLKCILTAVNADPEFELVIRAVPDPELLNRLQQMKRHPSHFHRVLMAVSDW